MQGSYVKKSVVLAMFVALVAGTPALAQEAHANLLGELFSRLSHQQGIQAELRTGGISFRDAITGSEICVLVEKAPQNMTLVGEIIELGKASPDVISRAMRKMAYYNFNSAVGTLMLDGASKRIRMEHHLNPQVLSVESIASAVELFESSVRAERLRFSQLTEGNLGTLMR